MRGMLLFILFIHWICVICLLLIGMVALLQLEHSRSWHDFIWFDFWLSVFYFNLVYLCVQFFCCHLAKLLLIHTQTSTFAPWNFWNRKVISRYTLWWSWLLIHGRIKLIQVCEKVSSYFTANMLHKDMLDLSNNIHTLSIWCVYHVHTIASTTTTVYGHQPYWNHSNIRQVYWMQYHQPSSKWKIYPLGHPYLVGINSLYYI